MLAYQTYLYSRTLPRFGCAAGQYSRLIQCAEALGKAPEVLRNTFTNAAWQDNLLNCAEAIAGGDLSGARLTELAHTLDPYFGGAYPASKTVVDAAGAAVDMPVAPFQYLNSHDHSHLIAFAGTTGDGPLPGGNRSLFYRLQPLAIALYTAQGVPMLWEGEEFADNFMLAGSGAARIGLRRDMHWQFFYDDVGAALVRLYRILGQLRRSTPALRSRQSYYYYQQSLSGNTILAYHRHAPASPGRTEQYAMVLLNFGSQASSISLPFPRAGIWTEVIDAGTRSAPMTVTIGTDGDSASVMVPSWYGYILIL
jgi:maltooligosyltrehalose trehalohydrolase